MKAFDPNYKLLDEMYQDDYYGNATEPPELRGDFLVCTKVSIGRN